MSKIRIRRAHALSPAQAREAANKIAAKLSEAFDMEFDWDDEVLRFQRSGVEGCLMLGQKEVLIDAQLGFLLAMMQPRIEQAIHENLDKIFGAAKKTATKAGAPKKAVAKKAAPKKK